MTTIQTYPSRITLQGRLGEPAKALMARLLAGDPVDDLSAGLDLLKCIIRYDGEAAPVAAWLGPDGIRLSDVALAALRDYPDEAMLVLTGTFRSRYARSLYAHLMGIGASGDQVFSVAEIREILRVGHRLNSPHHLWSRALAPALIELHDLGLDLTVRVLRGPRGRATAYRLTWFREDHA